MTIQDIINGIAGSLNGIDASKSIYQEYSDGNFNTPCFYIHLVSGDKDDLTGNFNRRTHIFDIQFYPEQTGSEQVDCYAMADKLLEGLEYILVNDYPLKGVNVNYEVVDRILHFMIGFNANVETIVTPDDDMAILEQNSSTKG